MDAGRTPQVSTSASAAPGEVVRRTRRTQGMTLARLGALTGYSASQVSRLERGESAMTDVSVLHRFAQALGIPPQDLGLAPGSGGQPEPSSPPTGPYPNLPAPTLGFPGHDKGEDPVRTRRQLLANLAVTAAAAMGAPVTGSVPGKTEESQLGEALVAGLRDAMLGLSRAPADTPLELLAAELRRASAEFNDCAYSSLALRLPRLIRAGHQSTSDSFRLLAQAYLLATRILVKLDEAQLGWMAADRARQFATAGGAPVAVAEAARQQAVLARKAGWHDQALALALNAADDPALRELGKTGIAQKGLLIQCAAYTVAHQRDQSGMRELTREAAAIAKSLGAVTHLRDTNGGFSQATVQLHLVSAETTAGDPSAAIAAADALAPQELPTTERRALYFTDRAKAFAQWGRRDECIRALLQAEYWAPQETHSRPAVKSLVSGLLVSGRTTPELRGLAARTGVPHS
ncbi:helix-turn-helix transcriptional regulator [Streptomyces sp. W1SF4]|uniref:helix-turn-helix domain-containing protein n=1 Tax=Streptomyces sp. W1SF4 TaxID=2305220 RepID=UPI000F6C5305|nr:helix-turn-helix transcriptional regulator [Streptomyces sp. W1SF4]AZM93920.1 XRE family transcriptional regulator [Streptomyces sp. W1SF4]